MKKNTDYSNLKSKTIFDFCDDEQVLDEIVVFDKERYLKSLKEYPVGNAIDLIVYAERTHNDDLMKAVKTQYEDELRKVNNE